MKETMNAYQEIIFEQLLEKGLHEYIEKDFEKYESQKLMEIVHRTLSNKSFCSKSKAIDTLNTIKLLMDKGFSSPKFSSIASDIRSKLVEEEAELIKSHNTDSFSFNFDKLEQSKNLVVTGMIDLLKNGLYKILESESKKEGPELLKIALGTSLHYGSFCTKASKLNALNTAKFLAEHGMLDKRISNALNEENFNNHLLDELLSSNTYGNSSELFEQGE